MKKNSQDVGSDLVLILVTKDSSDTNVTDEIYTSPLVGNTVLDPDPITVNVGGKGVETEWVNWITQVGK